MLPIIICIGTILVLVSSLYKERKTEANRPEVITAIRLNHLMQLLVILLAFWGAVDSERSSRQQRENQINLTASLTAAMHAKSIMHSYFAELMPARLALISYLDFKRADSIYKIPSTPWDNLASETHKKQRDEGLAAFKNLQKIAESVLFDAAIYDTHYPQPLITWAKKTLELNEDTLINILWEKDEGLVYAELLGRATGSSLGEANNALSKSLH